MNNNLFNTLWENIKIYSIMIVLSLIFKTSVVEAYRIPSGSMEDTLFEGDFLIANKFIYGSQIPLTDWRLPAIREPKPGDVVIFRWPGDEVTNFIKRCVAVEGQKVEIIDKILYVDGEKVPDPELSKHIDSLHVLKRPGTDGHSRDNWGPYIVPKDCYFMMGDNRDNSYDSRFWGPVHKRFIQGSAMIIHWSWAPDESAPEVAVDDPLAVPRLFLYNVVHFPERVRWSRLLNLIS